jgi:hypothetical protein
VSPLLFRISRHSYSYRCGKQLEIRYRTDIVVANVTSKLLSRKERFESYEENLPKLSFKLKLTAYSLQLTAYLSLATITITISLSLVLVTASQPGLTLIGLSLSLKLKSFQYC